MAGVMNPGQRRTLMDQVQQGLQIASTVYGIKSQMDEKDFRDEQRARSAKDAEETAAGNMSKGEYRNLVLTKGLEEVGDGKGGQPIHEKGTGALLGYVRQQQKPTIAPDNSIAQARLKLDQDKFAYQQNQDKKSAATAAVNKSPNEDAFKKLSKPDQLAITKLTEDVTKREIAVNQIDNQLKNMAAAWEKGDEGLAVKQGQELLKILNSDVGADAVGAEESKRLGGFLEYKIANFTGPGSFFGRDVDKFFEQAASKNNSMKATIAQSRQKIEDIMSGKGAAKLTDTNTVLGPKGGGGTAFADDKKAAPAAAVHPQASEAQKWANENRLNPDPAIAKKAQEILNRLGAKAQ